MQFELISDALDICSVYLIFLFEIELLFSFPCYCSFIRMHFVHIISHMGTLTLTLAQSSAGRSEADLLREAEDLLRAAVGLSDDDDDVADADADAGAGANNRNGSAGGGQSAGVVEEDAEDYHAADLGTISKISIGCIVLLLRMLLLPFRFPPIHSLNVRTECTIFWERYVIGDSMSACFTSTHMIFMALFSRADMAYLLMEEDQPAAIGAWSLK